MTGKRNTVASTVEYFVLSTISRYWTLSEMNANRSSAGDMELNRSSWFELYICSLENVDIRSHHAYSVCYWLRWSSQDKISLYAIYAVCNCAHGPILANVVRVMESPLFEINLDTWHGVKWGCPGLPLIVWHFSKMFKYCIHSIGRVVCCTIRTFKRRINFDIGKIILLDQNWWL